MVVLVAAAYLARERVLTPLVLRAARSWVRTELGGELDFTRLAGDWWSGIEVEGVSLRATRGPVRRVDDATLRATYSLPALLRGEVDWLRDVRLEATGIELELEPPRDETEEDGTSASSPALTLRTLDVALDDLTLRRPGAESFEELLFDRVRATGALEGTRVVAESLDVKAGANSLELRDFRVDWGAGALAEVLRAATGKLALDISDAAAIDPSGDLPHELVIRLAGDVANGTAELTGSVETEGGTFVVERGKFRLGDGDDAFADATLDVSSTVACKDLAPFGRLFGQELTGALQGRLDVSGPVRTPSGVLEGRARGFAAGGVRLDVADVRLRSNRERVDIERFEALGSDGLRAKVLGAVELDPIVFRGVALELTLTDLSAFVPDAPTFDTLQAQLTLDGPLDSLRGTFEADATQVVASGVEVRELRTRGSFEGSTYDIEELSVASEYGDARARVRVAPADVAGRYVIELAEWSSETSGVRCTLAEPNTFTVGPRFADVTDLALATDGGQALLSLAFEGDAGRVALHTTDFDTDPLAGSWLASGASIGRLTGRVDGTFSIAGDATETALALEIATTGARLAADRPAWSLNVEGTVADGRVVFPRFAASIDEGIAIRARFDAPYDPLQPRVLPDGDLTLDVNVEGVDASVLNQFFGTLPAVTGVASAHAEVRGVWSAVVGDLGLRIDRLELPGSNAAAFGACVLDAELALADTITIKSASLAGERVRIDATGSLARGIDVPALIESSDPWLDSDFAAELALDLNDIAWLAEPLESVRRLAGRASGGLHVGGTLRDPKWKGDLRLEQGELRLASSAPVLRELVADLRVGDGVVTIESLAAEVGGAPVRIGGSVTLPTDASGPVFDLTLVGENVLLARSASLRVRADADLAITGPLERLQIAGDVVLVDGKYARNIKLLRSILPSLGGANAGGEAGAPSDHPDLAISFVRDAPLAQATLAVDVRSAEAFEVDTNLIRASVRPELHLGGSLEAPILTGPILVDTAAITLPSGRLRVRSGVIEFRAVDPFVPFVALSADMNAMGYRVGAQIEGPYDHPEIILTSDPPLANEDLLLLVLTGRIPNDAAGSRQAAQAVAVFLAQDVLTTWLFSKDADAAEGFADRFVYEVGADVSESGTPTGRAIFYLGSARGGAGRSTYLVTEFDEYDDVNYGTGVVFRFR